MDYPKRICRGYLKEFLLARRIQKNRFPNKDSSEHRELVFVEKCTMYFLVLLRMISFYPLRKWSLSRARQHWFAEVYVLGWFFALIVLLYFQPHSLWVAGLIVFRLFEGFIYNLSQLFVNVYAEREPVHSKNRSLILLFINYFEIIIGFAALYIISQDIGYAISDERICILNDAIKAFYFSVVTMTTLGYGDITPLGDLGRALVTTQVLMGVFFIIFVFSSFLQKPARSTDLIKAVDQNKLEDEAAKLTDNLNDKQLKAVVNLLKSFEEK